MNIKIRKIIIMIFVFVLFNACSKSLEESKTQIPPEIYIKSINMHNNNEYIEFDLSDSVDSDGNIIEYKIEVIEKNGNSINELIYKGSEPIINWNNIIEGDLKILISIKDNNNNVTKKNYNLYINEKPIIEIQKNNTYQIGETILLDATNSIDNDGSIVNYIWTNKSTNLEVCYSSQCNLNNYEIGEYNFELKVIDNDGLYNTKDFKIYINTDREKPYLVSSSIQNNEGNIPTIGIIRLDFSENIIDADIKENIKIKENNLSIDYNYEIDKNKIIINYSNLDNNKEYLLEIDKYLKDEDGNILENNYQYIFTTINNEIDIGLDYLNEIRNSVGLNLFTNNTYLNNSAINHANYLNTNNLIGHYQLDSSLDYYTGYTPQDRMIYHSYNNRMGSENLSKGQLNVYESINQLMSAIYHRFGFLSLKNNEIGIGIINTSYVFDMGNSYFENFCKNEASFTGNGSYYTNICKDETKKISLDRYIEMENILIDSNPDIIVYPFEDQVNVLPYFFEEKPDPLPNSSVSGFPISIQFNENKYVLGDIDIIEFKLLDSITLLEKELLLSMNYSNDPNNKFTKNEFAIFPKYRLDYNTRYKVEIQYKYNGEIKNKEWFFTTRDYSYDKGISIENETEVKINNNEDYHIYIKHMNNNDFYKRLEASCNISNQNINFIDANSLHVKMIGISGDYCNIRLINDEEGLERLLKVEIN